MIKHYEQTCPIKPLPLIILAISLFLEDWDGSIVLGEPNT